MSKNSVAKVFEQYGEDIIQMRIDGKQIKEIASKYNLKVQTVSSYLARNNIRVRGILNDESINKIITMYNSGSNMKEIGNMLHFSPETVRDILVQNNIKIRSISQSRRKYDINENYFDVIDDPNKAYILGLLYADGNRSGNSNTITINLQEGDRDILDKIKNCIGFSGPLMYIDYHSRDNRQNQWKLVISNKHMAEQLYQYGVVPNKEFKVEFPKFLNEELLPHFIRGYLDGDGCICKTEKRVSLTGTEMLLSGIKSYVENKLGIHFSLSHYNKKNPITCDIRIAGRNQCKKFLDYIYDNATIYLNRKYELYQTLYC